MSSQFFFDFDYTVVNGFIRLVDLQGAYLGDIGECRYGLTDSDKTFLNTYRKVRCF